MRIRDCVLLLVFALAAAPSVRADEFDTLKEEFSAAQEKYWDKPEGQTDPAPEFLKKFRQLAEKNAGTPIELKSLALILQKSQRGADANAESDALWALKRLSERHAGRAEIGDVL